jgi:hypothetical protein
MGNGSLVHDIKLETLARCGAGWQPNVTWLAGVRPVETKQWGYVL